MSLTVTVKKQDNGYMVLPCGSIDTDSYGILEEKLEQVMPELNAKVLVLNMKDVGYISSLGIGLIVRTKKMVEERKGFFMMTDLQPGIRKVFDVVKALPGFMVFETTDEADDYFDKIQKGEIE